jgi:hypothetical protein
MQSDLGGVVAEHGIPGVRERQAESRKEEDRRKVLPQVRAASWGEAVCKDQALKTKDSKDFKDGKGSSKTLLSLVSLKSFPAQVSRTVFT